MSILPCRLDLSEAERSEIIQRLVREIASLWQTDELRRRKPTPIDGASLSVCSWPHG